MVKSFNVNLVIILTALITTIGTAPVWDDDAIMKVTGHTRQSARNCACHRRRDVGRLSPDYINYCLDKSYISTQIAEAVSKSVPLFFPFKEQQLFQEPNESMRPSQLQFARAYHSLVFERLKTLFHKIQHSTECFSETLKLQNRTIEPQISEILKNVLNSVATNLLRLYVLATKYRERFHRLCTGNGQGLYEMGRWKELDLPNYDLEPVRNILLPNLLNELAQDQSPICNDVTPAGMLECLQIRIKDVFDGRIEDVRRGLPFNLRTVLDPTPYVATLIAQIRSDS
ncbi:hypothetical protein SeLEV6574_g07002 [Synchytrium endobioticum]|uniref:Uncharacterized protein n=1 Tax=Synchytrium endobioticum TaxID=286115 RepID=A0A507CMG5_9FUNG|nr:hypothetical protein SeLEV6574_g06998 [Synchytrium endobioticum]TPX39756.1 hypothetical protein SeLEV6574_g07002 [Synchytrium endobioticum]